MESGNFLCLRNSFSIFALKSKTVKIYSSPFKCEKLYTLISIKKNNNYTESLISLFGFIFHYKNAKRYSKLRVFGT